MRTGIALLITAALATSACGSHRGPLGPTGPVAAPATLAATAPSETAIMARALQDEYRAEAIYRGVLDDFGAIRPFANVVWAENLHSASIQRLYAARSLTAPPSEWSVDNVPRFMSVAEACAGAVQAERENITMYDAMLAATLAEDVRQVLANNRAASLYNHLPAFQRCQ